jgi:hypothetical protein
MQAPLQTEAYPWLFLSARCSRSRHGTKYNCSMTQSGDGDLPARSCFGEGMVDQKLHPSNPYTSY